MSGESENNALLSFSVKVNYGMLSGYFFSPHGFAKDIITLLIELSLCIVMSALQNILPESFPEMPLFPAVCLTAVFAMRLGALRAYSLAFLCGVFLDAGAYHPLGMSSLLCLFSAFAARAAFNLTAGLGWLPQCMVAGFAANLAWVLLRLLLFADGMPFSARISLLPSQALLSSALAAFSLVPLMVSIHGLAASFIPKRK